MISSFKVMFCWAGHLTFCKTLYNHKPCHILVKDHAQGWALISAVKKARILLLRFGCEGQGIKKLVTNKLLNVNVTACGR
jgi:hypothetical protein